MFLNDHFGRPQLCALFAMAAMLACMPIHPQAVAAKQNASARNLIVLYRNGSIPGDAEGHAIHAGGRLLKRHERFGASVVSATASAESALKTDPEVEYVFADQPVSASSLRVMAVDPNAAARTPVSLQPSVPTIGGPADAPATDTFYNNSPQGWAVRAVGGFGGNIAGSGANGPWATTTGTGVRIAILDSGVDRNHPDIAPNLALNITEVDQTAQPSPCDDGSPQDQSGHGTWVASLAAGAAGANTGRVVGVAPSASILNIKVLQRLPSAGANIAAQCSAGEASGMMSWVLQGIDDALAQRADVIVLSMSVTLDLYSGDAAGLKASFDRVTHAASRAGAILVAAAGNDAFDFTNPRYVTYPAQARDVLAVLASTNPACAENLTAGALCTPGPATLAYYSNYGAPLNAIAAPGGSYPAGADEATSGWVRGACSSGLANTVDGVPSDSNHSEGCFNLGHAQYAQAIGTSASAPLAAGVLALVKAAHPDWNPATIIAAVRASAVPNAAIAYGVVNAAAAITYKPQ